MSTMTEQQIAAHAEARANLTAEDTPTETDFVRAEQEVRGMLAAGARYDETEGWVMP